MRVIWTPAICIINELRLCLTKLKYEICKVKWKGMVDSAFRLNGGKIKTSPYIWGPYSPRRCMESEINMLALAYALAVQHYGWNVEKKIGLNYWCTCLIKMSNSLPKNSLGSIFPHPGVHITHIVGNMDPKLDFLFLAPALLSFESPVSHQVHI